MKTSPKRLRATAAAPLGFDGPGDSLLPGSAVAQLPAAVPEPVRLAKPHCRSVAEGAY